MYNATPATTYEYNGSTYTLTTNFNQQTVIKENGIEAQYDNTNHGWYILEKDVRRYIPNEVLKQFNMLSSSSSSSSSAPVPSSFLAPPPSAPSAAESGGTVVNITNNYNYGSASDSSGSTSHKPFFTGRAGAIEQYVAQKFEKDPFEKATYILFGLAAFAFLIYAADKTGMDATAPDAEQQAKDALQVILVGLGAAMTFGFGTLAFIKSRELRKTLLTGSKQTANNDALIEKYGNRADMAMAAALIFGLAFAGSATAMYLMDSSDFNFGYLIAAPFTAIAASIYMHYADKTKECYLSKNTYDTNKDSVTSVAMKNWLAASLILAGLAMMLYSGESMGQFANTDASSSQEAAKGYLEIMRTVIIWSGSLMIGGGLLKFFEMQKEGRDEFRREGGQMRTDEQGYTSSHMIGSWAWLALAAISGAGFYVITQDQNAEGYLKIVGQALAAVACAGFVLAGTCAKDDMKANTALKLKV
jgi:hypothetical protein